MRIPALLALAVLLAGADAYPPYAGLPHESVALPSDPAVRWGRLSNGVRWGAMRNQQPPGKASLRLLVQAGSLHEEDPERGLMHFLEHMAFLGSAKYPPGTLVTRLQALGLAFGSHTNAHTGFDETVYKLDLPDVKPTTLAIGLEVLADTAGALLILPEKVASERGVILAEMRDRDGPGFRISRANYGMVYRGTRYADRLPIGTQTTVQEADAARLRGLYDAWYRPERLVVAVVGDVDPAEAGVAVATAFASVAARAATRPEYAAGAPEGGDAVVVRHEDEAEGTQVMVQALRGEPRPLDGSGRRRDELARELGERVYARRIRSLVEGGDACPLQSGSMFSYHANGYAHAGVAGQAKPGRALDALSLLIAEDRRLLAHGPTAEELAIEVEATRGGLDNAVAAQATRQNPALAQAIYGSIDGGEVLMSPAQMRDLLAPMLAGITPDEVRGRAAAYRARMVRRVALVAGREDLGADGEARVGAAWKAADSATVPGQVTHHRASWAYGEPPAAPATSATVAGDEASGLAGATALLVRASRLQPNQVLVQVRFAIPAGSTTAAIAEWAARGFMAGGLGRHPARELAEIFAGSSVQLAGPSVQDDAVVFSASGLAKDLPQALARLRAHLDDPGWRTEAEARIRAAWLEELAGQESDLDAQFDRRWRLRMVQSDPARRPVTAEEVRAIGFAQARTWLAGVIAGCPMSVAVVGDVGDPAAAFAQVARWLGRDACPPSIAFADPRSARSSLPPAPAFPSGSEEFTVISQTARALVRVTWPTDDGYDVTRLRRLNLLARCLSERMRIRVREQAGDAYSPGAWSWASDAWRGDGHLGAQAGVAATRAQVALAVIHELAEELAGQGVSQDLFDRCREPILKSIPARRAQNAFWLGVLERHASQPFRRAWAESLEPDYRATTPADLQELARRYLVKERSFSLIGVSPGR